MTSHEKAINEFFCTSNDDSELTQTLVQELIEKCKALPEDVHLLISERPLATALANLTVERFLGLVPLEKRYLARSIIDLCYQLRMEIRPGNYFLETLMEELEKLPEFSSFKEDRYKFISGLQKSGLKFTDLPGDAEGTNQLLIKLSKKAGIAPEYLLGSFSKVAHICQQLGIRNRSLNLSTQYHNFHSGITDVTLNNDLLYPLDSPVSAAELLKRAQYLASNGVSVTLFNKGKFNHAVADLTVEALTTLLDDSDENYQVPEGTFASFISAVIKREELRVEQAPKITLVDLVSAIKFRLRDREAIMLSPVAQEDPLAWQESELGKALAKMRDNLNWLAVSIGIKVAGDLDQSRKDASLLSQVAQLQKIAGDYSIMLTTGRTAELSEQQISHVTTEELLFDLYCLAVLEKRPVKEVIDTASGILTLINHIENPDPMVDLDILIRARLTGEPYVSLLGTQGLILRNTPLTSALEALRSLQDKVQFTIKTRNGQVVSIKDISTETFRNSIIYMGRHLPKQAAPDRILSVINNRIVPEIRHLPVQVIANKPHSLERVVELALGGIPARYPLRRPWRKIDLDAMVSHGNCLEPGIRNCMSCPVNTLYGQVMKSAMANDFEEIITYEATGCFEVYSGIWPYTGKKMPSLHGVFGGAASEMLGGYAAKRARAKFDIKHGRQPEQKKLLHLGWGGDGATFDIGFGNVSGLFSRLQKIAPDQLDKEIHQRALYVCYDNEGYQNTGNQYSAASAPGGNTTTNPRGAVKSIGNDLRKKPMVEIVADHGVPFSARLNIHRQEHIARVVTRALEDGDRGSFIHFLQPCTTGWKFNADDLTYDLSYLSEEGGLFSPVTIEHGVAYLETYPTPRDPGQSFLQMQARFKHLLGGDKLAKENLQKVLNYYRSEWARNLKLTGFDGEIPQADRFGYLEDEHRIPHIK